MMISFFLYTALTVDSWTPSSRPTAELRWSASFISIIFFLGLTIMTCVAQVAWLSRGGTIQDRKLDVLDIQSVRGNVVWYVLEHLRGETKMADWRALPSLTKSKTAHAFRRGCVLYDFASYCMVLPRTVRFCLVLTGFWLFCRLKFAPHDCARTDRLQFIKFSVPHTNRESYCLNSYSTIWDQTVSYTATHPPPSCLHHPLEISLP